MGFAAQTGAERMRIRQGHAAFQPCALRLLVDAEQTVGVLRMRGHRKGSCHWLTSQNAIAMQPWEPQRYDAFLHSSEHPNWPQCQICF